LSSQISIGASEPPRKLIAPWWHTVSVLGIFAFFAWRGAMAAAHPPADGGNVGPSTSAYLVQNSVILAEEILMVVWIWAGVHWRNHTLADLVRGRWASWRDAARDLAIALPFWVIWEATALLGVHFLYRASTSDSGLPYHVPTHAAEISSWLAVCIAAGICEEIVFRGYFMQQFQAMTGSAGIALVLQAIVFGFAHAYKGWRQVALISVLGILYGLLVLWRRNLRASMMAHAISDMYEGYLKFLLPWHP
jgi:uncharacterized protein